MTNPSGIVLLGSGRVAAHLGKALCHAQPSPVTIWSRTPEHARQLAEGIGARWCADMANLPAHPQVYIIAVSDDAIAQVAALLSQHVPAHAFVVHTSGATPASVLAPFFVRHGIFYPLQTFSADRKVDFSTVPICLWAAQPADYDQLAQLAQHLSHSVHNVDDAQRAQLHLAAVFCNNFTNYLQHIATSLLHEAGLPTHLLQPLLHETVNKLDILPPQQAQTGPATRGDQATMQRHLALLEQHPQWANLYRLLSAGIADMNHPHES